MEPITEDPSLRLKNMLFVEIESFMESETFHIYRTLIEKFVLIG